MTKKARGIEPCLAYESWSSVEESADPLQRSLTGLREARAAPDRALAVLLDSLPASTSKRTMM